MKRSASAGLPDAIVQPEKELNTNESRIGNQLKLKESKRHKTNNFRISITYHWPPTKPLLEGI